MKKVLDISNNFIKLNRSKLRDTEVKVGYDEDRNPIIIDFSECDNLVIKGNAGSGKSNLSNYIANQLAYKNSAIDLEIYAMQPVKNDVSMLNNLEQCEQIIYPKADDDRLAVLENVVSCIEEIERKVKRRISIISDMEAELKTFPFNLNKTVDMFPLVIVIIDELTFLTDNTFTKEEELLRVAFLESLERISNLNKDLKICIVSIESK